MKKSVCFLLCLWFGSANASLITYDVANITGNTWEYSYSIENNMLADDIEEFTVYFDFNLYENLAIGSTPTDWDPIVIQPDLGFSDGFYDALALVDGIASGDKLGGFSVLFDYLGTGTPGSQPFDIIDPTIFDIIDSGTTRQLATVPEPTSLLLLTIGLVGFLKKKISYRPMMILCFK